jgi:potassium/hydrogen antiporter
VAGEAEAILVGGALLLAAIGTSLVASRLRLPALLLFLAIGMAVGSDGTGWLKFSDYEVAGQVGTTALALILFDGGLSANTAQLRDVLGTSVRLATLGTIITALVTGVIAAALFSLSLLEGLLLGSILAATDTAAVFGALRTSSLRRRVGATLEGEAGLNDPVAILLVIGFMEWLQRPDYGVVDMLGLFAKAGIIGAGCGLLTGAGAARVLQRVALPTAGLYPVATLASAAVAFGAAESLGGSGFLAVYLTGVQLARQPIQGEQTIASFHQGLAWLAQIALFLTLGLLVSPGHLDLIAANGILLALALVLVARPLAVIVSTAGARYTGAERVLVAWAGLRGAVPVVLATYPVIQGIPGSARFFDVVFFAVVISTLLQGTTFEPLARELGLTTVKPPLARPLAEFGTTRGLGAELVEYPVAPGDSIVGRKVADLGLPEAAAINVIVRDGAALPPHLSTQIWAGDTLHLLVREEAAGEIPALVERWRNSAWSTTAAGAPNEGLLTRPWTAADGDASDPDVIEGALVVDVLRTRGDRAGALVRLENGRVAVTGASLAAGSARLVRNYAARRLVVSDERAEQGWWHEVAAALAR